ncbi:hypothetical protein [Alkalicoccus halolimnae]|uniref:Uncharacterized protein n=1 Tax=Alkalicoccus halolimnae TaxID=1667239 RepID=A0A5C7FGR3_9BACI|nr:hypothetical protein [Alkalicoccus halolimnae]TXF85464.1 hypothetical protein FTX54_07660 [Alkalicoccus halolimnae]
MKKKFMLSVVTVIMITGCSAEMEESVEANDSSKEKSSEVDSGESKTSNIMEEDEDIEEPTEEEYLEELTRLVEQKQYFSFFNNLIEKPIKEEEFIKPVIELTEKAFEDSVDFYKSNLAGRLRVRFLDLPDDYREKLPELKELFGDKDDPILNEEIEEETINNLESMMEGNDHKKEYEKNKNEKNEEVEKPEYKPVPSIGMSTEQVLNSSWGTPQSRNITETTYGTREQWVYGVGNYLYFDDGVLTSISSKKDEEEIEKW